MKTFALVDGDLAVASGTYLTLSGGDKIRQDLGLAMREQYGSDRYHPRWGSTIGRFVGQPLTAETQQKVTAEVSRVLRNYVQVQGSQITADTKAGLRSALDTSDVVQTVRSIKVNQVRDGLSIVAQLVTMAGEPITIGRTVVS